LITKRNSYNYLILNGDINYSYSYSFLKHNEKVNRKTKQAFIGYSPSNFRKLSLSNLLNSKEEVLNINEQFDGVVKLQDTATKEDFLSNSSDAKIIHLATHADIGKNPWIAFSDQKLELHELYTYKNNADLVTLSACNTSLGELAKGEGVLSLARGFFYSGSKSVVSSLWSVNDQSTSEIMTNFYANIGAGQSKSEALNNAKRSYLANHTLSELSPYYWSSFILIGDSGSIDLTSNSYLYFFLGLFGVALVLFFRKKIKKSG
jgi:CHAT domain-containing protein